MSAAGRMPIVSLYLFHKPPFKTKLYRLKKPIGFNARIHPLDLDIKHVVTGYNPYSLCCL